MNQCLPSFTVPHPPVIKDLWQLNRQNHIVMGLVCWAISIHCRYIYETGVLSLYGYGHSFFGGMTPFLTWINQILRSQCVSYPGAGFSKGWMLGLWGFGFSGRLFRISSAHSLPREIWLSLSLSLSLLSSQHKNGLTHQANLLGVSVLAVYGLRCPITHQKLVHPWGPAGVKGKLFLCHLIMDCLFALFPDETGAGAREKT